MLVLNFLIFILQLNDCTLHYAQTSEHHELFKFLHTRHNFTYDNRCMWLAKFWSRENYIYYHILVHAILIPKTHKPIMPNPKISEG